MMRPRHSKRAAICETAATFEGFWGPSGVASHAGSVAIPGAVATCMRKVRPLSRGGGGAAERDATRMQILPSHP